MNDPYTYWRDGLAPCDYYDDTIALWPMLRAWFLLRTWRIRFWLAHKVLRRPLDPVPSYTGSGGTTTTTLGDILKAPYIAEAMASDRANATLFTFGCVAVRGADLTNEVHETDPLKPEKTT